MALPQQAIERLVRAPVGARGWHGRLLAFSASLFFLSILVYLGLTFGYRPYLDSQIKTLEKQITDFGKAVPKEDQEKIAKFYSQLVNLRAVLERHIVVSPVLEWLERNTLPAVYYTKFSVNTQTGQLTLGGSAKSVNDIGAQLQHFTKQPEVLRASFSNVNLGSQGLWQFDFTITLDPASLRASAAGERGGGGQGGASSEGSFPTSPSTSTSTTPSTPSSTAATTTLPVRPAPRSGSQ